MLGVVIGLIGIVIWITRLVTRINVLEMRLSLLESRPDTSARLPLPPATISAPPVTSPPMVMPAPPLRPAPAISVAATPRPHVEPAPVSAAAADTPAADDAWELTVGGSWLNKIGVLVFVIGLALLVGYSVTRVGPAGRIAVGFIVSLVMLAGGVVMERREAYRAYAYGLIAGGWAGTYFTTYAMRAVDAARVLESDIAGVSLLLAVSAGMVWHSLRYRSQEVTALAYVVAFATLALTPLHVFALVASVPLALSVIVVAQRFAWPGVHILGIACTYGLYAVRGQAFGFGDLDPMTFTPYAALAVYWVIFEVADLAGLRRRTNGGAPPAPLFLLNAAGLVGAGLLQLPADTPVPLSTFLTFAGAAYLASALIRARLSGVTAAGDDAWDTAVRGSYQGASALAAAFVAWAIELRFAGSSRTIALLMEAQLLFLSGFILRDWLIRGLGSAVAILAGMHAIDAMGRIDAAWTGDIGLAQSASTAAVLAAGLWYANREGLRSRRIPPLLHEWTYTPMATWLVVLIAGANITGGYAALVVFALALVLLEAGLRRGREYRYQAYLVGGGSAFVLLGWFVSRAFFDGAPTTREAWWMLGLSALVAYVGAWRLAPGRNVTAPHRRERVIATAVAGTLGTAFIVTLEWMVVDPALVGAAWAATAVLIGAVGLWRRLGGVRWQAYPVLLMALLRVMGPVLSPEAATTTQLASALAVIAVFYGWSLAVRGAIAHAASAIAEVEDAVRMALSVAASAALVAVIYNEVRPTLITVTWGLQAAGLLVAGFPARERLMRLSGLGVLLACIARLFLFDLPQLEELARIVSFVALGAVLLSVSWIYTRYRTRIQKYL